MAYHSRTRSIPTHSNNSTRTRCSSTRTNSGGHRDLLPTPTTHHNKARKGAAIPCPRRNLRPHNYLRSTCPRRRNRKLIPLIPCIARLNLNNNT
jgi:hypothetical protein